MRENAALCLMNQIDCGALWHITVAQEIVWVLYEHGNARVGGVVPAVSWDYTGWRILGDRFMARALIPWIVTRLG